MFESLGRQKGRYDPKREQRWFAPSGISRPNKAVALAQKGCLFFQPRTRLS